MSHSYPIVAFPRGRPVILPLSGSKLPGPTWERGLFYFLGGRPVQWLAERWKNEDVWACPTLAMPDPERPGFSTSIRMVDLITEDLIPPVDDHIIKAAARALALRDRHRIGLGLAPTFQPDPGGPRPTATWHTAYVVAGQAYMFVGERWREGEHHASPSPCFADKQYRGVMLTTRMLDDQGSPVSPVSFDEVISRIPVSRPRLAQLDAT